jgi:hypothetical protein
MGVSLPALHNNATQYALLAINLAFVLDDPARHWLILLVGKSYPNVPNSQNHRTIAMNETESKHLQDLLTIFDARALGEGDATVGANLLAAMALALSNLARPGSGIQTPDMRLIEVSCNLLASGARLSDMIRDEVVTPVGRFQNNILAHVGRLLESDEEQNQRPLQSLAREWNILNGGSPSAGESKFLGLMTLDPKSNLVPEGVDDAWLDVVDIAPNPNFHDMVRSPRAFIAAASPGMLDRQLRGIHAGQAFITIALNRASDAGRFGELCAAIINGLMPLGPSGEITGGRLLVTDPGNVLPEAARQAGDQATWLGRLVWLVSGNAGPELPPQQPAGGKLSRLTRVSGRFEHAAQQIFANRMNLRRTVPLIYKMDFTRNQIRWMEFLEEMESSLPGISGTARHLFAALVFGLRRIFETVETPQDFNNIVGGIEALARFLVRRMASARAAILFSAQEARKLRLKQKILIKLSEGCLDLRSIYHPLHLDVTNCEAILLEMATEGLVRRRGKKWECVIGAALPGSQSLRLPLEV